MAFNLGTIWAEIGLNTKKLDDGLMKAQTKLATADKEINTMGQKLTLASTKMMVAGGIMAGAVAAVGVASIKTAKEFDTSMRNVNSIAKLSEQEFQNLSKDVVDLSKKLPQSAKTLADGLYDISSSGFAGAEGMKVLEAAAKAASAGMTDTATSAKGITAVLNAYGKEAEDAAEISDTMFATVDKGVITFEELSNGIGNVLSTANLASIEFNELSGMIAYMTTKGVSADETMTALNRLILNIIKPSEDLAEVLHNAGYESGEAAIKAEGLTGVLALMETASGGSLTKLQKLSPEMRALKASGALLGGGIEELTKYMNDFRDTTGATQAALDEQSKSLDYQLDLLKNNIDAIKITLGSELVPEIAKTTGAISEWISKNSDLAVILTKVIGGTLAGGGGLLMLLSLMGKIRGLMMTTGGAVGVVSGAFIVLNGAVDKFAETLDNSDRKTGQLEGTLLRTLAPLTMMKDGIQENVIIAQALADGYLSASEAGHVNIFTIQKYLDLIEKRKAAEANITEKGIPDYIEIISQKDSSENINIITLEKLEKATEENTVETTKATIAAQQNEAIISNLMITYSLTREEAEKYAEAEGLLTTATEDATEVIDEQKQSVDELRDEFNKLINDIFGHIITYNDFEESNIAVREAEKALAEAIKEHGKNSDEATRAQNDLDDAMIDSIQTAFELSTSIEATAEQQEEARQKAVELGLEFVNTGQISEAAFVEMAKQFGMSADDIFKYAEEMGIELDIVTRQRIIQVDMDYTRAKKGGEELAEFLNILTTKRTVEVDIAYNQSILSLPGAPKKPGGAMGGMITPHGVVQSFAAGGMVLPQTGNPIPILAHEGEMILNSSQQGNLINALWGVANGKDSGGSINNNFYISELVVREEADVNRIAGELYNMQRSKQIGAGIR